jgi:hypothetical protein
VTATYIAWFGFSSKISDGKDGINEKIDTSMMKTSVVNYLENNQAYSALHPHQ